MSALGLGHYVLNSGEKITFPPGVQVEFDYKAALENGAILKILTYKENVFNCIP
ncbi:hypothetical protein [Legionella longbeachae]|uniref:Uncharacterized protein n=1 Tax=Legionella longbeachae serogroup 1 (strain NSW150) TaxID=661367 RepID=D3HSV7_LEGLN|nr:hypothetical protein [Legionella longbeachae]EEZ94860.1 hypothetical protein LLB_0010 [Legionella longbeachae D-4968]CBJ11997.1 hypothetical protein LLO_1623 [Legionella longbeachae NSW150]